MTQHQLDLLMMVRVLADDLKRVPAPGEPRSFGLTWEDACSREAHRQCIRFILRREPEPGECDGDPPSVAQPPPGWVPPPIPPPPPPSPPGP